MVFPGQKAIHSLPQESENHIWKLEFKNWIYNIENYWKLNSFEQAEIYIAIPICRDWQQCSHCQSKLPWAIERLGLRLFLDLTQHCLGLGFDKPHGSHLQEETVLMERKRFDGNNRFDISWDRGQYNIYINLSVLLCFRMFLIWRTSNMSLFVQFRLQILKVGHGVDIFQP